MADLKISQLTGATTPLAGTEVLPIVQSGSTRQVSVANLTAGRTQTSNGIVQGTAGTGYNFTANTPAAGMTSQLLNWYEEGTWTPNQGSGLAVVGTFSSSGTYTRIGRKVTVIGKVNGSTSVQIGASNIICTNLPFTSANETIGISTDYNLTVSGGAYVGTNTTLYSTVAIPVSPSILFQITYFV